MPTTARRISKSTIAARQCDNSQRATGSCRGFTLIEVMVAIAVLAIVLSVVYESFGWSMRRMAAVQQRQHAWLVAQSQLASLRLQQRMQMGVTDGVTADGYRWSIAITQFPTQIAAVSPSIAVLVEVTVSWGVKVSHSVHLNSVEIARVPT